MRPKLAVYRPSDTYRFAHLKRDGIWLTIEHGVLRTSDGWVDTIYCRTRHPTDVTRQLLEHPTIERLRNAPPEVGDAEFYCELYSPGHDASYVKSALAGGRMDELRIEAFATPDLCEHESLIGVQERAELFGLPFAPWREGDWPDWREQPDAEGLVYKDGNLLRWAKHKLVQTADVVCVGFKDGDGKYLGLVGAIECALADGTVVARCSGMSDAERVRISDDPDAYIGRVLEVSYQYVGSRGRLRHPRFVRWRDDKRAAECTEL